MSADELETSDWGRSSRLPPGWYVPVLILAAVVIILIMIF